jgi:hypothetical protein
MYVYIIIYISTYYQYITRIALPIFNFLANFGRSVKNHLQFHSQNRSFESGPKVVELVPHQG